MIKKIIWTTIFLLPIILGGISIYGDAGLFDSSSMIGSWISFVDKIFNDDEFNVGKFFAIVWLLIVAFIWTAPFWYAWKGTFIVGWVPLAGLFLRIGLIAILLVVPPLLTSLSDSNWAANISYYLSIALIVIALLGLWLKS